MPTYVYKNLKTGQVFELEQRITEAVLKKDPKTGDPVERVIQASGIVFKGSGFYKTDSRPNEKSGKEKKTDADASLSSSASSDSANSDSSNSDSANSDSGRKDSKTKVASTDSSTAKSNSSDSGATSKPTKSSKKN